MSSDGYRVVADLPIVAEHPTLVGYGASADGRVWSRYSTRKTLVTEWQRQLRTTTDRNGYLQFKRGYLVHRFVLECFVGPCPDGMECRHLDGSRTNNALSNLEWGTPSDNYSDRIKHGTSNEGTRNGQSKLSELDVLAIRADDRTHRAIAADYGVHHSHISDIKNYKKWSHVR